VVVLEDEETFTGTVITAKGEPVQGARVTVIQATKPGGTSPAGGLPSAMVFPTPGSPQAETDQGGRFSVRLSMPYVSEVRVTKEGYKEERVLLNADRSVCSVVVRLDSMETGVIGHVVNAEGKPVTRFIISLLGSNPDVRTYQREIEDSDGRFLVSDVQPGAYRIYAQPVSAKWGITMPQEVTLRRGYFFGEVNLQSTTRGVVK
jgi:hypothetical protein